MKIINACIEWPVNKTGYEFGAVICQRTKTLCVLSANLENKGFVVYDLCK